MSTAKFTIELPAVFQVMSRGQIANVAVDKLSDSIIARAAFHGIKQKVADAAASASDSKFWTDEEKKLDDGTEGKVNPAAQACAKRLMDDMVARLIDDEWTAERGGVVDPYSKLRTYIRAVINDSTAAKAAATAKGEKFNWQFKDRVFDGLPEGQRDAVIERAQELFDKAQREAKENAKIGGDLKINL